MSLLEQFEEMHRRIIALERLVGVTGEESEQACTVAGDEASVVPWYENIPKEGIECWVDDNSDLVREERDNECVATRTVYGYDSSERLPFKAMGDQHMSKEQHNMIGWTYAIPVDPNLRLPDGAITS